MVIEQIIEIPESHQLMLDLPKNFPKGAKAKLSIKTFGKRQQKTFEESLGSLYGCLKANPVFEGDPVDIQQQMRNEWDRKKVTVTQ